MCELLGMSANVPTDICFSFRGLMERGGRTGPHRDGWGIAFYEGRHCRTFHDPAPSAQSPLALFLNHYPIKSVNVVCHIRQATHGRVCLENTHPFLRELWGLTWSFAHNGKSEGVKRWPLSFYTPVGTTDSEHAFCWILGQLRARWPERPKRWGPVHRFIHQLCDTLRPLGTFNMLMSNSKVLYTYCTTDLCWITRRAPFGPAQLIDADFEVDFKEETTPDDIVTMIATRPLTCNEAWNVMSPGEMRVFQGGLTLPLTTPRRRHRLPILTPQCEGRR